MTPDGGSVRVSDEVVAQILAHESDPMGESTGRGSIIPNLAKDLRDARARIVALEAECALARGLSRDVTTALENRNADLERKEHECDALAECVAHWTAERNALAAHCERLGEALESVRKNWRRPDEGRTEYFERMAEDFYRATGFMAPGKSQPLEMGDHDEVERQRAWAAFFNAPFVAMEAALAATPPASLAAAREDRRRLAEAAQAEADYLLTCVGPIPGQELSEDVRGGIVLGVAACRRALCGLAARCLAEHEGGTP